MTQCPELSVIGVPKAGTTSVHVWLKDRAGINGATPKETFFFIDEGNPMANANSNFHHPKKKRYEQFFESNTSGKTLDSTTHYLYSETALKQFRQHQTKVCVVLREPVGRLVSYFNYVGYARSGFISPIDFTDFATALLSDDVDAMRPKFSDEREFFSLKTSLDQGNYQKYLKKWIQATKPENLKIMFFEDLIADRDQFLNSLAEFFQINVLPSELNEFEVQNEGRHVKYPALNQFLRSASNLVTRLPFYETMRKNYHSLQSGSKIEFDWHQHATAIEQLRAYYRPLNKELFEIVSLDSNRWDDNPSNMSNSSPSN